MTSPIGINSAFIFVRQSIQWHRICILCLLVLISAVSIRPNQQVLGDDSLDLNGLASLGASMGINSQMIGALSSLLNQPPKSSSVASMSDSMSAQSDQEQNFILNSDLSPTPVSLDPPVLRRSPASMSQNTVSVTASTTPAPSSGSGGLGSIVSMIPNLLSGLNLNGLGGLMSGITKSSSSSTSGSPAAQSTVMASAQVSPTNTSAQTVINQVLTAYAAGQIPNELIQLGLSGRVPTSIVELALSGQVPPQVIQMVITGKIPVTTIKAFLSAIDQSASAAFMATAPPGIPAQVTTSKPSSLTRSIFEALFRPITGRDSEKRTITVPTLFGPVPIQLTGLPNIKRIGQFVGGTITNVASMIPF